MKYMCIEKSSSTGALSSLKWANVPDDVVYACAGSTVTFPWQFKVSENESVVNVNWNHDGALSSDIVATLASGYFVATEGYSARVRHVRQGGLVLGDVTVDDSGNYTVKVSTNSQGIFHSFEHSVYLQVADGPMLEGGQMRVEQSPEARWDTVSRLWLLRLTCGAFTFRGPPPVNVTWTTPRGNTIRSTGYQSGLFYLDITTPVQGGNYTCTVPPGQLPTLCVRRSNDPQDPKAFSVSLVLDEVKTRLSLLEANQKMLREENENLRTNQNALSDKNMLLQANQTLLGREKEELQTNQQTLSEENVQLQANQTWLWRETEELQTNQQMLQESNERLQEKLQELEETHARDVRNVSDYCQEVDSNLKEQMNALLLSMQDKIEVEKNVSKDSQPTGPCHPDNYTIIDDPRRVVAGRYSGNEDMCDRGIVRGWYRFLLRGKSAVIPTTCVPDNNCHTDAPTWLDLQGQPLPLEGREVRARACSHWSSNCCNWQAPITVRNCGDYYVYKVQPLSTCDLSFCVEPQA